MSEGITRDMMMVVIQLGAILFAARLGNILFEKLKLPGVLGELTAGILIGPYLLGALPLPGFADGLFPPQAGFPLSGELYAFATVASIVLLFMVGMETDLKLFMRFSVAGSAVGFGGMVVSFLAGDLLGVLLSGLISPVPLSPLSPQAMFLGVVLTATSVGITARVLSDHRKLDSPEGVTILAGAVIDDVLGIVLLAVVLGILSASRATGRVDWGHIGLIAAQTVAVWLVITALGLIFSTRIGRFLKTFKSHSAIATMGLGMALILAGLFEQAGLAMIIGAYIMGLSLSRTDIGPVIRERLHPIFDFLVPVFFTAMGMLVNLKTLASTPVILFGLAYTAAAVVSKIVGCGGPALFFRFNLRGALRIGMGMVPRGEVALIVSGVGLASGFLPPEIFGIAIIMTLITTMASPSLLVLLFRGGRGTDVELAKGEEASLQITLPSPQLAELVLDRLRGLFQAEGFYIHQVEVDRHHYQLRKDTTMIVLRVEENELSFDCRKEDVPFIHTSLYEVMGNIRETIAALQKPLDSRELARKVQEPGAAARPVFNLSSYLKPRNVIMELRGDSKEEVLAELVENLCRLENIADREAILQAVQERERSMSTGMQHGIAIPHARTGLVDRLVCLVGLKRTGVSFDSLDGEPARIFILTLSPVAGTAPHVQFMSAIAQALNREDVRQVLLSARTPQEVVRLITGREPAREAGSRNGKRPPAQAADTLDPQCITLDLRGSTREEVIDELLELLQRRGLVQDLPRAREVILGREQDLPTGLEKGLAIPHGRTRAVDRLVCAIGISRQGVDFHAVDGQLSHLVVLTLTPIDQPAPHVQFMSSLVRALASLEREEWLSMRDPQELYRAIVGKVHS